MRSIVFEKEKEGQDIKETSSIQETKRTSFIPLEYSNSRMTRGSDAIISDVNELVGISNFQTWRFQMKNLIIRDDLWYIITSNDDQVLVENEEILRCKKQRSFAMINLSMKDEVILYISKFDDPQDVWNKLESLFATTTLARRLPIRNRLYNARVEEGGNVYEYLKIIEDLKKQLVAMGYFIQNKYIIMGMLNALLKSYESFVQTITSKVEFPIVDKLMNRLQHEEMKRELKGLK